MKHSEILEQAKVRLKDSYDMFDSAYICYAVNGVKAHGSGKKKKEITAYINSCMKADAQSNKDRFFINSYGLPYWLYLKGCISPRIMEYNTNGAKYFVPDVNTGQLQYYRERYMDKLIKMYKEQGK
jgi:hypothetical protein